MAAQPPIDKVLKAVVDEIFVPERPQRRVKAAFWAAVESQSALGEETVSLARALQVTGDTRLERWWRLPGFADWFGNKHELTQKLEYLCTLGADCMETLFLSDDPKLASAQVNAFKALMEARGKMQGKQNNVKYLDSALEKMTEHELDKLLESRMKKLTPSSNEEA